MINFACPRCYPKTPHDHIYCDPCIAKCVKACAGIANPEAIQDLIRAARKMYIDPTSEARRHELRKALANLDAPSLEGNP